MGKIQVNHRIVALDPSPARAAVYIDTARSRLRSSMNPALELQSHLP
ncbi:hypothetical protein PFRI_33370 [Planktotalea frisia]|jgi:hypothetical protein|uniref:Uncharacterized protein n=1 Tax=Planktotalea frisia TaxID=696762 RepID=A0A1L9NT13_9RHOB|nr:hypothetical protein PFRI_33370 [Planktotalea frisia]